MAQGGAEASSTSQDREAAPAKGRLIPQGSQPGTNKKDSGKKGKGQRYLKYCLQVLDVNPEVSTHLDSGFQSCPGIMCGKMPEIAT